MTNGKTETLRLYADVLQCTPSMETGKWDHHLTWKYEVTDNKFPYPGGLFSSSCETRQCDAPNANNPWKFLRFNQYFNQFLSLFSTASVFGFDCLVSRFHCHEIVYRWPVISSNVVIEGQNITTFNRLIYCKFRQWNCYICSFQYFFKSLSAVFSPALSDSQRTQTAYCQATAH